MKLFAPKEYWNVPKEIRNSWGCGPGGLGDWLVPDTVYGLSIKSACMIHDWYYRHYEDDTEYGRKIADRVFRNNMIRIVTHKSKSRILERLRLIRINTYYLSVRKFGAPAYFEDRNTEMEYRYDT